MKPFQKSVRWFHFKETLQNQWFWNTLLYTCKHHVFYKQSLKWNHSKNKQCGFMSEKHHKTNGFGTPLLIHAKILRLYTHIQKMKPFQKYLKWFHFKETLQSQCFQQPACQSKQQHHMCSKQSLKWNHEKVASFQRNTRKPMLSFEFL